MQENSLIDVLANPYVLISVLVNSCCRSAGQTHRMNQRLDMRMLWVGLVGWELIHFIRDNLSELDRKTAWNKSAESFTTLHNSKSRNCALEFKVG